jgi:hypothetical protein
MSLSSATALLMVSGHAYDDPTSSNRALQRTPLPVKLLRDNMTTDHRLQTKPRSWISSKFPASLVRFVSSRFTHSRRIVCNDSGVAELVLVKRLRCFR